LNLKKLARALSGKSQGCSQETILKGEVSPIKKMVSSLIQKKIEQDYKEYFEKILDEQSENGNRKANMRELVGLKVGLEYLRDTKESQERRTSEKNEMNKRRKQNKLFAIAMRISESSSFQFFIASAIIVNTLILSLDSYPEN
jgi:hypothetical protein